MSLNELKNKSNLLKTNMASNITSNITSSITYDITSKITSNIIIPFFCLSTASCSLCL